MAHSTYGEAPICYTAAIEEATKRGREITIDVQRPAMAGLTAHPSMLKMLHLLKRHPEEHVRENIPDLDIEAIKADMDAAFKLRFLYRQYESKYNKELLDAMRPARVAGGASATLKSISALEANLSRLLETDDWDEIQIAIYKMQAEILEDLGDPTQVTPYAANTTGQAAISLANELEGKDRFSQLYPGIVNYLVGRHGKVPDTVNPELVKKALEQEGLTEQVRYVPAQEKENGLEKLKQELRDAGIENPTNRQAISLVICNPVLRAKRIQHIVDCHNGENKPQPPPELPDYAQPAEKGGSFRNGNRIRSFGPEHIVEAIGKYGELQKLAERSVHLKQLKDKFFFFPPVKDGFDAEKDWYDKNLEAISEFLDSIPVRLQDAGFRSFRGNQNGEFSVTAQYTMANFAEILKDACDAKCEGLYNSMMEAVDKFRKERGIAPVVSIIDPEKHISGSAGLRVSNEAIAAAPDFI